MSAVAVKNEQATLSVVIPALNAAGLLPATLDAVRAGADEIVVCDGGSSDATREIAERHGARVVAAPRGRGVQIAAAVAAARGAWLLLLHADTVLDAGWERAARAFIAELPDRAAYFRFALASADWRARRLERLVAWRCRRFALPYGDQGLLISRALLERVGGVRPMVMLEDVDLVRRLGRRRLAALDVRAVSSPARWERDGWIRRSARNQICLALYFLGVPPATIRKFYG